MSFVKPTQYKIPQGYDYKNFNLNNFSGLNNSDNPFEGDPAGCSDCSNVYVNETNALAVRPRLHWEHKFSNVDKMLNVVSLTDDKILYYFTDEENQRCVVVSDNLPGFTEQRYLISTGDDNASFFLNGDGTIMCTSCDGLFYADDNENEFVKVTSNDPKVYIPTVRTNMVLGDPTSGEKTIEPINLLANKYKYAYMFDLYNSMFTKSAVDGHTYDMSKVFNVGPDIDESTLYFELANLGIGQTVKPIRSVFYISKDNPRNTWSVIASNEGYEGYDEYDGYVGYSYNNTTIKTSEGKTWNTWSNNAYNILPSKTTTLVLNDQYLVHVDGVNKNSTSIGVQFNKFTFDGDLTTSNWIPFLVPSGVNISNSNPSVSLVKLTDTTFAVVVGLFVNGENSGDTIIRSYFGWAEIDVIDWSVISNTDLTLVYEDDQGTSSNAKNNDYALNNIIYDTIGDKIYCIIGKYRENGLQSTHTNRIFSIDKTITKSLQYTKEIEWTTSTRTEYAIIDVIDNTILIGVPKYNMNGRDYTLRWEKPEDTITNYLDDTFVSKDKSIYKINLLEQTPTVRSISNISYENVELYRIPDTKSILSYTPNGLHLNTNILNDDSVGIIISTRLKNKTNAPTGRFIKYVNGKLIGYTVQTSWLYGLNTPPLCIETWKHYINIEQDPYKSILYETITNTEQYDHDFSGVKLFDNKWWFFRSKSHKNKIVYSFNTSLWYIPQYNYMEVGKDDYITNLLQLNTTQLGVFKAHETSVVTKMDVDSEMYSIHNLKTSKGSLGYNQATVIPTTNVPVVITDDSVAIMRQSDNNDVDDTVFSTISDNIFETFSVLQNKAGIKTHTHGYYLYLYYPYKYNDKKIFTQLFVLDCRTFDWYKWYIPVNVVSMYESEDPSRTNSDETETRIVTDTNEYTLTTSLLYEEDHDDSGFNDYLETYQDYLGFNEEGIKIFRRIPWHWTSRLLTLGTTNYLKKITNLQMIFSDKARKLEYTNNGAGKILVSNQFLNNNPMFYELKTYRKKSKFLDGNFVGQLDGVGIKRIKTRVPKCDFVELKLSNYRTDGVDNDDFGTIQMYADGEIISLRTEFDDPFRSDYYIALEESSGIYNAYDRLNLIGITFKLLLSEGIN